MTDEPALLAVLILCCALLIANLVGLVWFAVAHAKYGRDRFEEFSLDLPALDGSLLGHDGQHDDCLLCEAREEEEEEAT